MNAQSVLVLDDDVAVCRILSRILSEENYEVDTSLSVEQAVGNLSNKPYDAYVLDYRLQDGTGLDVAERVRDAGSGAPIILISGYGSNDLVTRAAPLRIFDIIQKPFSQESICKTLKRALATEPLVGQSYAQDNGQTASVNGKSKAPPATRRWRMDPVQFAAILLLLLVVVVSVYLFIR
jgi:DNA-binding NtrC family response regulator